MIENSKTKFDFPSAEEIRQSNVSYVNNLRKSCIKYIEEQLKEFQNIPEFFEHSSSLIISFHKDYNNELLFDCTKEVLLGKGFDISIVDNGRAKGIAVKW